MPTYSYKCTECGNAFDVQQAFTDDSLTTCPVCAGALRKVFNTIGVTFNGSGFYRTDSRAAAHGPKKARPDSAKPDSAKPDSAKPASAKPDSAPKSPSPSTSSASATP